MKALLILWTSAALCGPVSSYGNPSRATSSDSPASFDPRGVMDLVYRSRPDSALVLIEAQRRRDPSDPFLLLFKAKVMRERLNDEDNNKELIKRSAAAIHAVIDSAIALSNEALRRDARDTRQYYYRGYGYLNKAQLHVLCKSFWSAARTASRGKDDLERYLEKHPDDPDARGILGAYLYFADALPGFFKFIAKVLFISTGDRERGLEMMRYAATHDAIFATDWRFVVAAVDMVFEGDFERGTDEFAALLEEFPYYTRLAEPLAVVAPLYPARTLELRGIAETAVRTHASLDSAHADRSLLERIRLLNAFTDSYFGRPQEAIAEYTAIISAPPSHPDWVVPIARLNRGYLFQKTGDVGRAREDFDAGRTSARTTYYYRTAQAMLDALAQETKVVAPSDLDFVAAIYEGRFDEAARGLEAYKKKHGEDASTDFYEGDLAALRGDFESARRTYERATRRSEFGGSQIYQMLSCARLAELAGMGGRYEKARELLRRAREHVYANYLLRFLLQARERFYELEEKGKIRVAPNVFSRRTAR